MSNNATLDKQGRPVVAVTGMGLFTSLGSNRDDCWRALVAGRSGLETISRFPINGLRSTVAGTIDAFAPGADQQHSVWRSIYLAMAGGLEAVEQAEIGGEKQFPGPLFLATPPSEFEWPRLIELFGEKSAKAPAARDAYAHMQSVAVAQCEKGQLQEDAALETALPGNVLSASFGTTGVPTTVCTACASGATAIGLGVEAIRRGEQAALVIGADASVHQEAMVRFSLLSAVSTHNDPPQKASRPFDKTRSGFVVAEGAAALVLENYDSAKARGAKILGVVRGYGERADDFHRTRSKPDGSGMIGAIQNALDDADVAPDEVDHVNAHGTSTPENDKMEALALTRVFGERIRELPVVSNKGQLGHCLLAAGAVEAVISLLTINNGVIPPTMNYETPDPNIDLDVVANKAREARVKTILSNSFGFGGQNACLVFSSGEEYE